MDKMKPRKCQRQSVCRAVYLMLLLHSRTRLTGRGLQNDDHRNRTFSKSFSTITHISKISMNTPLSLKRFSLMKFPIFKCSLQLDSQISGGLMHSAFQFPWPATRLPASSLWGFRFACTPWSRSVATRRANLSPTPGYRRRLCDVVKDVRLKWSWRGRTSYVILNQ